MNEEDLKNKSKEMLKEIIKKRVVTFKDNLFGIDLYNIYKNITDNINKIKNSSVQPLNENAIKGLNIIKNLYLISYIIMPIFLFAVSFYFIYFIHVSIILYLIGWILSILILEQTNQDMLLVQFNLKYSILGALIGLVI